MSTEEGGAVAAPPPPSPGITTKAELDHLTENRAEPAAELHLTPDGPDTADVNEQINAANETRMCDLRERLQQVRDGTERDFSFAQVNDRAKMDFERSR